MARAAERRQPIEKINMDASAWLGLALGAALGGGYALWQGWALRRESRAAPSAHLLAGTTLRLALLVVTLLLAVRFTRPTDGG